MNLTRALLAAVLLMSPVLASLPASAQITERNVSSGRATLDPARGYVFMRTQQRLAGVFLRVGDEASLAAYREARATALVEAREDWQRAYASWERRMEQRDRRRTDPPVEPTEETLAYPSFESTATHPFGPDYVYSENEAEDLRYAYLTVLPPGRYVWYGPVFVNSAQGPVGACYCMGSVQFDVSAGRITDLGNFLTAAPRFEDHPTAQGGEIPFIRLPTHSSEIRFGLPSSLAAWPSQQAEFHASGKTNNIYGIRVTRLAPIPGVLGYHRDVVVDERTGEELAAISVR